MRKPELTYRKYGTNVAGSDETNDGTGVQQFAYDGTRAMLQGTGWAILPGPVERRFAGTHDGEEVYSYLWPIAAEGTACGLCRQPGHREDEHPLPKDHPQYDAFYDASDDELGAVLATAIRPGGADHPHADPGDGRTECGTCGKFVWPVIHSCKGVPVTQAAQQRAGVARPKATPDGDV